MGRISPSPSRAFTPHYSHSLNFFSSLTPLTTRTFTLSSSRSLKNLKIRTLTTRSPLLNSTLLSQHPAPQIHITPPHNTLFRGGVSQGGTSTQFHKPATNKTNALPPQRRQGGGYHKGIQSPPSQPTGRTRNIRAHAIDHADASSSTPTTTSRLTGDLHHHLQPLPQHNSLLSRATDSLHDRLHACQYPSVQRARQPPPQRPQGGGYHKGTLPLINQHAEPDKQQLARRYAEHIIIHATDNIRPRRRYSPTPLSSSSSRQPSSQPPRTRSTDASIRRNPSIQPSRATTTTTPPGRGVSRGSTLPDFITHPSPITEGRR